ncbi:hypothetical protein C5167_003962 [Papaver somniferum]|nr:hypothetical protein C5167_003962 [Papaver somniferum]
MAPQAGKKQNAKIQRIKDEVQPKGITLTVPPTSTHTTELDLGRIALDQRSDRKVTVSLGKLSAGLPVPLFDPENPLFYEILSHLGDRRVIY